MSSTIEQPITRGYKPQTCFFFSWNFAFLSAFVLNGQLHEYFLLLPAHLHVVIYLLLAIHIAFLCNLSQVINLNFLYFNQANERCSLDMWTVKSLKGLWFEIISQVQVEPCDSDCQSKREPALSFYRENQIKQKQALEMTASSGRYLFSGDFKDHSKTNLDLHLHYNNKKQKKRLKIQSHVI